MTEEEDSDAIPINRNPINIFTKTKVKLPSTESNHIIKQICHPYKLTKKKFYYSKINFQKVIINNIKKYNININQVNSYIINNIMNKKNDHLTSKFRDDFILYFDKEFFKKYYIKKESKKRIPNLYLYYKNYFKFFLKPMLSDLFACEVIRKNGDKQANCFYEKNNDDKKKNKDKDINNVDFSNIFTKSQKKEIEISNNNSKKILSKDYNNKNQSTICFSYDSLNNSKIKNNGFQNDLSISFSSIENLINQNKNLKLKNEQTNEEDCLQNKIKLLNLNDKTITQKTSTMLTSARSKKFETIKERNNNNIMKNFNNKYFYSKYINNEYNLKTINIWNKKEKFGNYVNNKKEIEYDIYLDSKIKRFKDSRNNMISSNQIKYSNKNMGNEIRNYLKDENQKDILIVPKKHRNDFKTNNYINTNININSKINIKTPTFTNENTNKNNIAFSQRFNSRYNNTKKEPLKIDYYKSTQIISNNNKPCRLHSSVSDYKKPINVKMNQDFGINKNDDNKTPNKFRDYCISSTQITKIKKKIPASRNIKCDLANNHNQNNQIVNQKSNIVGKNIFFSVYGLNHLKQNDILYNNKIFFDYNLFYKSFKKEKNWRNAKMSADIERSNFGDINISDKRSTGKTNLRPSSSMEFRKKKLNKLIKELECLTILKNAKIKNGQDGYAILEHKRKMQKNKNLI